MAIKKLDPPDVQTFHDHQIITPPNPLQDAVRRVADDDQDDPVARAENALKYLSHQFHDWMVVECERLSRAYKALATNGYEPATLDVLFRAAHDIKGQAATLGYPAAALTADNLCRLIEHSPDLKSAPPGLVENHIDAIKAIVRERHALASAEVAEEINERLRKLADDYLLSVNADRPDHLEAIIAPPLAPR